MRQNPCKALLIVGLSVFFLIGMPDTGRADPGGGMLRAFTTLFKFKQRRDAYRQADQWLNGELQGIDRKQEELRQAHVRQQINMQDYRTRLVKLSTQKRDMETLHQRLKKHAHDEFNRFLKTEALTFALNRLGSSKTFNRHMGNLNRFLGRCDQDLTKNIDQLKKIEKVFWPDEIRQAHEAVQTAQTALRLLNLIGAGNLQLEVALKTLNNKLNRLRDRTRPRTIEEMRKDLDAARGDVRDLIQKTTSIAGKLAKTEAAVMLVGKRALDDPDIKQLVADIAERQGEIDAAYTRKALGPEMIERLRDLGTEPDAVFVKEMRRLYTQRLREHAGAGRKITPESLDAIFLATAREVTGLDLEYAGVEAVIKAGRTKGPRPFKVTLNGAYSKGKVQSFVWRIGGSEVSRGASFSHTFEKAGTYEVTLTVSGNRGQVSTDRVDITVTEPATLSLTATAEPDKVPPGGVVTIVATPVVQGVQQGDLELTVTVMGKVVYQSKNSGDQDYDTGETAKYTVPEDAKEGTLTAKVRAVLTLNEEMKAALGKNALAAEKSVRFQVKKGAESGALFAGSWKVTWEFQEHSHMSPQDVDPASRKQVFTLNIKEKGDTYVIAPALFKVRSITVNGREMVVEGVEEDYADVPGGGKRLLSVNRVVMTLIVSEDGMKLNGTVRTDYDIHGVKNYQEYQIDSLTGTRL